MKESQSVTTNKISVPVCDSTHNFPGEAFACIYNTRNP
jgi:hypothetical protein